jgi:RNA polymerase sigma-70 factor (sigma-E family)
MPAEPGGSGAHLVAPQRGEAQTGVRDLFRDHHVELVRLALLMVGDQATAEDVVQDAFERLYRGWHGLREPASSLAYVRSSVLNGCRSVHRRAAVARKYRAALAERQDPGADLAADEVDASGEMVAALRQLPSRQREVIVLRYYADLDVPEIARTLRISQSGVRATMSRGLAALARLIEEGGR